MTYEELAARLGRPNPVLDEDALARLEQETGARLPDDFIAFLKVRNGDYLPSREDICDSLFARFPNNLCLRNTGYHHFANDPDRANPQFCESLQIREFYALDGKGAEGSVITLRRWCSLTERVPDMVPANLVVFGDGPWGDQFVLDLGVPGGEVIWCDHEQLPVEGGIEFPTYDGVFRLEMTFGQFVAALEQSTLDE
jgi:hypothetical protein